MEHNSATMLAEPGAAQRFAAHYGELNQLARQKLAATSSLTLIDVSSLVHETYLRMERCGELPVDSKGSFLAYSATVMRSVLMDYLREKGALKRGSGKRALTLVTELNPLQSQDWDIEALDRALAQLADIDSRAHQVVEMRFFGGFSLDEIAEHLGASNVTVWRSWEKARAFLYQKLHG